MKNVCKIRLAHTYKGVALVIVLWMLSLLSILAVTYSSIMRTETMLTSNLVHGAKAKALAEAGIWQGITELLKPFNERIWLTDGSINSFQFNNNKVNVRLFDETGKIDLNLAKPELIRALFESIDIINNEKVEALSDAVKDWRDRDSLTRLYGAEDEDYERQGYSYGAKDGLFNTIDEIQQVIGMTSTIYKRIKPLITIYSRRADVDKQVASREVLMILPDMTATSINELIERREQMPSANIKRSYSTTGKAFTIYSEGKTGKTKSHISVVVLFKSNKNLPFTLLAWQEDETIE